MRCVLTGVLLLLAPTVQAGDARIVGNWKVVAIPENRPTLLYLMRVVGEENNKYSGNLVPMTEEVPPGFIDELKIDGDVVRIKMRLQGRALSFEGKLAGAGKNINGSVEGLGGTFPAYLEATKARSKFEVDRELVEKSPNDPRVPLTVLDLLKSASAEKAPLRDVQDWVELALRSSATHGPRWHSEMTARLLSALADHDYVDLAVKMSKKMEADFDPMAPFPTRVRFLEAMAGAHRKARKTEEAGKIDARIDTLENEKFAEHEKASTDVPIKKFAGRKSKSTRGVLVELFTGAQCPPCVAADLAFDALGKTYQPSEVILLQYHLHVPAPDPLTNTVTMNRADQYDVRGTPSILFNGKVEAPGGGRREDAKGKYDEYRGVVEQLLEKPATVSITLRAVRKGDKVQIIGSVRNTGKPSDKIKLRLALVEEWVRYKGGNGMLYHHHIVRAMPGGVNGMPLPRATGDIDASIDLDTLRRDTAKYLEDFAQNEAPFPGQERPLRFRNLKVVAFVQDDMGGEVLQAVQVAVKEE